MEETRLLSGRTLKPFLAVILCACFETTLSFAETRLCNDFLPPEGGEIPSKAQPLRIYILVSFSMPPASLKALYQEAKPYGARLVVRGLFHDSFEKTRLLLQSLEIEVEVDPELFTALQAKAVPIFVVQQGEKVETLCGHTTLRYAVEKLASTFPDLHEKLASCGRS